MGADGGTVPKRSEQVKKSRKEEKVDPHKRAELRLSICALSGLPLAKSTENLVCDSRGNVFNLESVLEHLVDVEKKPILVKRFGIKKIKDLTKLKADMNKDFVASEETSDGFVPPFVCPFTGHLANGIIKFVVLKPCGHVMCQKSLIELSGEEQPETSADSKEESSKKASSSSSQASPSLHADQPLAESSGGGPTNSSARSLQISNRSCPVCQKSFSSTTGDIIILASGEDFSPPSKEKKRSKQDQVQSQEPTPSDEKAPPSKRAKAS